MRAKNLTLILLLAAAAACAPKSQTDILSRASSKGVFLYAHQDDLSYGKHWKVEDPAGDRLLRSDVKEVCGHYPAMVGFDLGGIELGNEANLDGVSFEFMRRAAREHVKRGGLVTFSWHPRNPLTGGDAWDVSSDKVVESVLEGGEKHEEFVQWLDRGAEFIGSLGVPVLFRPWHENLGSWFWWGGRLCTPEQYKALWELTRERFAGAGDILWVYSPNGNCTEAKYRERYPGAGSVDVLGFDTYQSGPLPGSRDRFISEMQAALGIVSRIAAEDGKLYCVSETGFEGIPDPEWWTGTLLKAIEGYSPCYLLTWRNAWDRDTHYFGPWPGSPDSGDFADFAASGKVKMID